MTQFKASRRSLVWGVGAMLMSIAAALGLGCDQPRPDSDVQTGRPDVFLVVLDAAAARYFGAYGEPRPTSPQIDRLAAESVVFSSAYSQSATTVPSTVSLLSGVRGTTHRMTRQSALPGGLGMAPELFAEHGYRSFGFIGNPYAGAPELGLAKGYDEVIQLYALSEFQGRPQEKSSGFRVILPEDLNRAVELFLPDFSASATFAYFHYLQPHKPYDPPARYRALLEPELEDECTCDRKPCPCGSLDWDDLHDLFMTANHMGRASDSIIGHLKSRYRANIRYVDDGVGALLDALRGEGLYEDSLIVLMADHGEAFFEHGRFGHNRTLYDDMVRIPLMIKFPRAAGISPRRIDALVETVDVLPTVFDFLGFPIPADFEGQSLWPLISDPASQVHPEHEEVILATNRLDQHAIRLGRHKYIAHMDGKEELYDLVADPGEQRDLSWVEPGRARALRARLSATVNFESVTPQPVHNELRSDPEMDQLLEVLGYLREDDEEAESPQSELKE